jgi:prophage regulatory protein
MDHDSSRQGRFLRMPDVVTSVGLSQATINRLHRSGDFPKKVRISANATGWWEGQINAWKARRTHAQK